MKNGTFKTWTKLNDQYIRMKFSNCKISTWVAASDVITSRKWWTVVV